MQVPNYYLAQRLSVQRLQDSARQAEKRRLLEKAAGLLRGVRLRDFPAVVSRRGGQLVELREQIASDPAHLLGELVEIRLAHNDGPGCLQTVHDVGAVG